MLKIYSIQTLLPKNKITNNEKKRFTKKKEEEEDVGPGAKKGKQHSWRERKGEWCWHWRQKKKKKI